jgi:DivIVA domain-containing protein
MTLTPEDVRDKKFATARGLKQGYDLAEVDAFLEEVQTELGRLLADNAALRSREVNSGENNTSAVRMLELAQRTADEHLTAAHREAERIIQEARERVARLTEEAEGERASLERRVEDLRAFEREYRTRLRSFIESQIGELDGRGQD